MVQRLLESELGRAGSAIAAEPWNERLQHFYRDYARMVFNYEWVRLFAFSGLDGLPHHMRFVTRNRAQLFHAIARELRHDHGMPTLRRNPADRFRA